MIDVIISAVTNLFRIYLIVRFVRIFVGKIKTKEDTIKESIVCGIFLVVNTSLYFSFFSIWINVLCNLIGISLIAFLYTRSVKGIVFLTGAIYLLNMGCDTIAMALFKGYKAGEPINQIYAMITVFLFFICVLVTEKIVENKKDTEFIPNFSLILVPVCSMGMILFMVYRKNRPDIDIVIISAALVVLNFLVFYIYNILLNAVAHKYENEILQQKLQIYSSQLDIILKSEEKVKLLKHDMKHHINEIKLLAINKNCEAIENYVDSMVAFVENPNETVSSGNVEIDSLLNYMILMAKKELLIVETKVKIPKEFSHIFDINIILGNLLENAIEAAKKTEEKWLAISIKFERGALWIEIVNSFNGILSENIDENGKKQFLTSKKEAEKHGIGLKSVENVVKKHKGMIETQTRDNKFYVKLMIYI